jgi:hypothetical protein
MRKMKRKKKRKRRCIYNKKRCKIIEFEVQEESWDWEGEFDVVVGGGG